MDQQAGVGALQAARHHLKLVTSNSLGTDSITQTIIVSANPVASVATTPATSSTSATGAATITVSSGTSPYSYLWSNGGSASSITNVVSGDYSVTVVDANGCQYVDDTVHISYVNGIIELNSAQQVKIYPNPAYDVLNLVWSEKSNADVAIVDLNGKIISSFVTIGDTRNDLNIKNLASGAYILRITDKSDNQQHSLLFSKF
jgi:PKD repeat protein